ncbi:MAG: hypothetical protein JOZ39_02380 [Chloroflexi bacterium]|nr:hypothetical protein [Chloroflexota bacterium]
MAPIARFGLLCGLAGLAVYVVAGAYVASRVRADAEADDPAHPLDLHALASIVMCWPHDIQSLRT